MSVGAQGVISVASNIAPRKVSQMVRACSAGNMEKALSLHEELYWLFKALFVETNPGPVKAALSLMYPDVFWPVLRLPLAPMSTDHLEELKSALFDLGFLQERKRSRDGQV
jgi:4-hydroxy-tetrahydrodipicolinate synthase